MAEPEKTNAEVVNDFSYRLWGGNLAAMAACLDVNLRTLARIRAAANEGQDFPAARGVIGAMRGQLASALADLTPWADRADQD
jgi:hypothetical protein